MKPFGEAKSHAVRANVDRRTRVENQQYVLDLKSVGGRKNDNPVSKSDGVSSVRDSIWTRGLYFACT